MRCVQADVWFGVPMAFAAEFKPDRCLPREMLEAYLWHPAFVHFSRYKPDGLREDRGGPAEQHPAQAPGELVRVHLADE